MSERESNARREIKEASIGGLAHKLKDTGPQQADASEEGQGPAGEAPDRKQEIFALLQRAIEGNEDAGAVAQELGARRNAQLMEAAVEIELFERKSATAIRELMQSLTAAQTLLNRALMSGKTGPVSFQQRVVREKWLLVAALIVGVALGSALVSIEAFWGSMASLLHP